MMPNTIAHPFLAIGLVTRWLSARQPDRPLRGLTRFGNLLDRVLAPYRGPVSLADGMRLNLDSHQFAERWLLLSGTYQPAVTHALRSRVASGAYCLDVGANLGFYTIAFAKWAGAEGRVAAFEANPAMVQRVAENVALNGFTNVTLVEKAVSDHAEDVTFYVRAEVGKSSLLAGRADESAQSITVGAITIDDFMAAVAWDRLDVIKMDIEGNDCAALLGASAMLTRFRPFIVFEYARDTPSTVAEAAFSLLVRLGYHLSILNRDGSRAPMNFHELPGEHVDVIAAIEN